MDEGFWAQGFLVGRGVLGTKGLSRTRGSGHKGSKMDEMLWALGVSVGQPRVSGNTEGFWAEGVSFGQLRVSCTGNPVTS